MLVSCRYRFQKPNTASFWSKQSEVGSPYKTSQWKVVNSMATYDVNKKHLNHLTVEFNT